MKQHFSIVFAMLALTFITSLASHAEENTKICATYKAKIKFLNKAGSKAVNAKAKSCTGTAQWVMNGAKAGKKIYMILVYFNLGEFETGTPEGNSELKKRFKGDWQRMIFFHSEFFSAQKWSEKFKKSTNTGKGTIVVGARGTTIQARINATGTGPANRVAHINLKTTFTDLGLSKKASKKFWVDDKIEITLDVPVSEIQGDKPVFKN